MKRLLLAPLALSLLAACGHSPAHTSDASLKAGAPVVPGASSDPDPGFTGTSLPPSSTPGSGAAVGTGSAGTASSGPAATSAPDSGPQSGVGTAVNTPTPNSVPPVGPTVTVDNSDDGTTVHLTVGQTMHVHLEPQGSMNWDPPQSSSSVMKLDGSKGGYPTSQPLDAELTAQSAGSATVSAQSDIACHHTNPQCMIAARDWSVTVVVSTYK
jgi:hypothetical protein